jgi:hypothetical protein
MSGGEKILLQKDKAQQVLESQEQRVMIFDEKGEWTGKCINKSFVISTDIDRGATEEYLKLQREKNNGLLDEPKPDYEENKKWLAQKKKELFDKGVL